LIIVIGDVVVLSRKTIHHQEKDEQQHKLHEQPEQG
jgi:hypothetical protein